MKNLITIIISATALAGCASTEPTGYGTCALPITREAGMGVVVEGCAAWVFGPTPSQKREFDARARARGPLTREDK